ncbi:hypothetical protein ACP70R_014630 [Stipagrostis hirtigluma subsp. patula]
MAGPPPPPALPEELVEEILLRFSSIASLVRAALVSRCWYRIVSDRAFRRLFRARRRPPPVLVRLRDADEGT